MPARPTKWNTFHTGTPVTGRSAIVGIGSSGDGIMRACSGGQARYKADPAIDAWNLAFGFLSTRLRGGPARP